MLPRRPYGERRNDKTARRTSLYFQQLSQCDSFAGTDRRLASFGPRTRLPESDSAHSGNGETRLGRGRQVAILPLRGSRFASGCLCTTRWA
jgi:hypothetical protein